jgi:2'-5' RNA ligase
MAGLARRIDEAAGRYGVALCDREFVPHVTLARLKVSYDVRRWLRPDLAPGADACRFVSITLFESKLSDSGSTYSPLSRFEYRDAGTAGAGTGSAQKT